MNDLSRPAAPAMFNAAIPKPLAWQRDDVREHDWRVTIPADALAEVDQVVEILRPDGFRVRDVRPLVRVNVSVVAGDGTRQESGSHGFGGHGQ